MGGGCRFRGGLGSGVLPVRLSCGGWGWLSGLLGGLTRICEEKRETLVKGNGKFWQVITAGRGIPKGPAIDCCMVFADGASEISEG